MEVFCFQASGKIDSFEELTWAVLELTLIKSGLGFNEPVSILIWLMAPWSQMCQSKAMRYGITLSYAAHATGAANLLFLKMITFGTCVV